MEKLTVQPSRKRLIYLLALIPGVGHYYLGLMKSGFVLMSCFVAIGALSLLEYGTNYVSETYGLVSEMVFAKNMCLSFFVLLIGLRLLKKRRQ